MLEVAIPHFFVAKISRPESCLRPCDTCGAHSNLATLANHHKELNMVDLRMPNDYDFDAAIVHPNRVCEVNLLPPSNKIANDWPQRCRRNFRS